MSDDYLATTQTSGTITVGDSATGEIETSGDHDWFEVTLEAGKTYRIDLEGSPGGSGKLRDPYLRGIHDSNGNLIAGTTDDDGGAGRNSRLLFTAQEGGTYYVAAGGYGSRTGTYTLSVTDVTTDVTDDHAAGTGTTGMVAVGSSATGEIETAGDRDWFKVTLEAGKTYRIDLEGSPSGSGKLRDPYLRGVHDSNGNLIAGTTDDDGGAGYNSRLLFTAQEGATYYVAAGAYGSRTGTYTLLVTDVTDDHSAGTGTTGTVAVGGSVAGEVETARDRDWFAVTFEAGETYVIDLEGADSGGGTLDSTVLVGVYDAEGERIAGTRTTDGGEGEDARLVYTATETGTHYIAARGSGQATGTYTVRVDAWNGSPAFGQASYAFELAENASGDTVPVSVDGVTATDPDGDSVEYSIEGGNADGLFAIDAQTGDLFYTGSGEDYESGPTHYELTVRASDGAAHSDVVVTVTVTDVEEYAVLRQEADAPPVFAQDSYTFDLAENADGSTLRLSLGRVKATDPDDDPVEYSIEGGNADGLFAIDAQTGDLFYTGSGEDYESGSTHHELTVRASAGGAVVDVAVTINVTDDTTEEGHVSLRQDITTDVSEGNTDLPATTSTTGAVTVGGSVTGEIDPVGDRDWFEVYFEKDKTYRIDMTAPYSGGLSILDPYIYGIHDSNGNRIAGTANDNGGTNYNARLYFDCDTTGTYYVAAGAFGSGPAYWAPSYTLSVLDVTDGEADDFSADTDTTGSVEVGGDAATGTISPWTDKDWFKVELVAGKYYEINLRGSWQEGNTLYDPKLHAIYDADGNRYAGPYGNWGDNRIATFAPLEDGSYYVAVGAYGGDDDGTYSLSVTDITNTISDDFQAGTGTTGRLRVSGHHSTRGDIDYRGDQDWFRVTLEADTTYRIDLEGRPNVLFNPLLRGIHDSDGNLISYEPDNSFGDKEVEFTTPNANGYYYVAVGANSSVASGDYTLSIEEVM